MKAAQSSQSLIDFFATRGNTQDKDKPSSKHIFNLLQALDNNCPEFFTVNAKDTKYLNKTDGNYTRTVNDVPADVSSAIISLFSWLRKLDMPTKSLQGKYLKALLINRYVTNILFPGFVTPIAGNPQLNLSIQKNKAHIEKVNRLTLDIHNAIGVTDISLNDYKSDGYMAAVLVYYIDQLFDQHFRSVNSSINTIYSLLKSITSDTTAVNTHNRNMFYTLVGYIYKLRQSTGYNAPAARQIIQENNNDPNAKKVGWGVLYGIDYAISDNHTRAKTNADDPTNISPQTDKSNVNVIAYDITSYLSSIISETLHDFSEKIKVFDIPTNQDLLYLYLTHYNHSNIKNKCEEKFSAVDVSKLKNNTYHILKKLIPLVNLIFDPASTNFALLQDKNLRILKNKASLTRQIIEANMVLLKDTNIVSSIEAILTAAASGAVNTAMPTYVTTLYNTTPPSYVSYVDDDDDVVKKFLKCLIEGVRSSPTYDILHNWLSIWRQKPTNEWVEMTQKEVRELKLSDLGDNIYRVNLKKTGPYPEGILAMTHNFPKLTLPGFVQYKYNGLDDAIVSTTDALTALADSAYTLTQSAALAPFIPVDYDETHYTVTEEHDINYFKLFKPKTDPSAPKPKKVQPEQKLLGQQEWFMKVDPSGNVTYEKKDGTVAGNNEYNMCPGENDSVKSELCKKLSLRLAMSVSALKEFIDEIGVDVDKIVNKIAPPILINVAASFDMDYKKFTFSKWLENLKRENKPLYDDIYADPRMFVFFGAIHYTLDRLEKSNTSKTKTTTGANDYDNAIQQVQDGEETRTKINQWQYAAKRATHELIRGSPGFILMRGGGETIYPGEEAAKASFELVLDFLRAKNIAMADADKAIVRRQIEGLKAEEMAIEKYLKNLISSAESLGKQKKTLKLEDYHTLIPGLIQKQAGGTNNELITSLNNLGRKSNKFYNNMRILLNYVS